MVISVFPESSGVSKILWGCLFVGCKSFGEVKREASERDVNSVLCPKNQWGGLSVLLKVSGIENLDVTMLSHFLLNFFVRRYRNSFLGNFSVLLNFSGIEKHFGMKEGSHFFVKNFLSNSTKSFSENDFLIFVNTCLCFA